MQANPAIPYTQFLNETGQPVGDLPAWAHEATTLTELYRWLVLTRLFDDKAIKLQRTGKLGTYPSSLGQEAVAVGMGSALQPDDVFCPVYREHGTQLMRGVTMAEILSYWGGDERGNHFKAIPHGLDDVGRRQAASSRSVYTIHEDSERGRQHRHIVQGKGYHPHDFPNCVPLATQCLHAAGVATAIKLRQEQRAVLLVCGDGATSRGDFYEAINLAGAWQLPLVVLINNNQWAISVPRSAQTGAATLAQKGIASGIPGEQIDGNDIIAVKQQVEQALKKARQGQGPTVIEALTYRLADHTTADDARRYRDNDEVTTAWQKDPVKRLKTYLSAQQLWGDEQEAALLADCHQRIETEVATYLHQPPQPLTALFDYLYAELPQSLIAQRDELVTHADE